MHYNHFRYYDPELGRYITSDPIGIIGGMNTYGYARQNPVIYIDPKGLLFGINAGESYGDSAAQYWANKQVATGNDLYAVPGALASLWTPETSNATALTLLGGYGARVFGPFSPRGVPKYLQRLRKHLRFDRPHHRKGWQFDGTLPKKLRDLFGDKSNMFLPPLFPFPDYSSPDPIPDDIYDAFCRQNPSAPNCQNRCP